MNKTFIRNNDINKLIEIVKPHNEIWMYKEKTDILIFVDQKYFVIDGKYTKRSNLELFFTEYKGKIWTFNIQQFFIRLEDNIEPQFIFNHVAGRTFDIAILAQKVYENRNDKKQIDPLDFIANVYGEDNLLLSDEIKRLLPRTVKERTMDYRYGCICLEIIYFFWDTNKPTESYSFTINSTVSKYLYQLSMKPFNRYINYQYLNDWEAQWKDKLTELRLWFRTITKGEVLTPMHYFQLSKFITNNQLKNDEVFNKKLEELQKLEYIFSNFIHKFTPYKQQRLSYKYSLTTTGRIINDIQNWKKDIEFNFNTRKIIKAPEGYDLYTIDVKTQELCMTAKYIIRDWVKLELGYSIEEDKFIQIMSSNDPFQELYKILGVSIEQQNIYKPLIKQIIYAKMYGANDNKILDIIDKFNNKHPELETKIEYSRLNSQLTSLFKWINYQQTKKELFTLFGRTLVTKPSYKTPNFLNQNACADWLKIKIIRLLEAQKVIKIHIINIIHDEIIIAIEKNTTLKQVQDILEIEETSVKEIPFKFNIKKID